MTVLTKNRLYEQYLDQMTHFDFHNWKTNGPTTGGVDSTKHIRTEE